MNLPEISQNEFLAHIEDDDFFRVYGNPVMVNCDDGGHIVIWLFFICFRPFLYRYANADLLLQALIARGWDYAIVIDTPAPEEPQPGCSSTYEEIPMHREYKEPFDVSSHIRNLHEVCKAGISVLITKIRDRESSLYIT